MSKHVQMGKHDYVRILYSTQQYGSKSVACISSSLGKWQFNIVYSETLCIDKWLDKIWIVSTLKVLNMLSYREIVRLIVKNNWWKGSSVLH